MKKNILPVIVLSFCLLISLFSSKAQTLYGTTLNGGSVGGGTINKFMPATNDLSVAHSFNDLASHPFYTNFIQANNGKLYAMTNQGGSRNFGVIFSLDPATSKYTKVKDFETNLGGINPAGSLLQASNGKLYGMTREGGNEQSFGVIFSFDPVSFTYIKEKGFDGEDGAIPYGSLIQASNGKLYGITSDGGNNYKGVIFSFDPVTSTYAKLHDFNGSDGANPYGSLMQADNGKLYGMTYNGGTNSAGVIFSFDPSLSAFTKLYNFDSSSGGLPNGSLTQAANGKLYGITSAGGINSTGVIFSFDPASTNYTKLRDFDNATGDRPFGDLSSATDGRLYGMTNSGGSSDAGVIFSFDPSSSVYTKQKDFDSINGANPKGSLFQASDGNLYGMTFNGGSGYAGVVFSFNPLGPTYKKLHDFDISASAYPFGSLVQARNKKLYGMTRAGGGNFSYGTIYSFDPVSSTYMKLHDFNYYDGTHPYGTLTEASNGKLYGMAIDGANGDYGSIFSFDPYTATYTKLLDFNSENGAYPVGSLTEASDGKLYGLTSQGGNGSSYGVIFSFDPATSTYTKLKEFEKTDGSSPFGSLLQASDGKLYGLTLSGGSGNNGVIFSFDPLSSVFTLLNSFDKTNGARPYGSLVQAGNGKLYGLTVVGGSLGYGVIFSYDPLSSTYTKLKDFDKTNGANPYGSLMQASDGKLYGMTYKGGSGDAGVIFSYDPSSATYAKLKDYNTANGANPYYGSAFIELKDSAVNTPPTVSLITPANNATYLAGGNVYLTAIASDADGTISKVDFYNGATLLYTSIDTPYAFKWEHVHTGTYTLTAKATDNSGLVTVSDTVHISVVPNTPPTVSIINPANGQTFLTGATVHLQAAAADADGRIGKVEFYNGTTLLATEHKIPYTFDWKVGKAGNYTLTAKATDNWGAVTTSATINISVVPNQPPTVSIISPSNGLVFTAPATINVEAAAQDADGRIVQLSFYRDSTVLTSSEHKAPYTYQWQNVPAGTYTFTAVAKDNWSAETTSAPVTITVTPSGKPLVSGRLSSADIKSEINSLPVMKLLPNPARSILNISITGLQRNMHSTISIISASGVLMKTLQTGGSAQTIPLNVSSLASGVYLVKIISGDKVMYKQFVKL